MEIVLIRHGESEANRQGIVQGHFDSPLSEAGLEQAAALAEALAHERFEALYASDLLRARQTGEAIARRLGLSPRLDPMIREIDIGLFSGRTWADIAAEHPEDYRRFKETGRWSVVPGAESEEAQQKRVDGFLATLRVEHSGRIAVVAHGAILRRTIHTLLNLPFPSGIFFELHNASYSEIHLTPQGPSLVYLNRLPQARIATASTRVLI
ncbi:MAG TPA: histidine phosphatase family protein [Stenomitos sp.]